MNCLPPCQNCPPTWKKNVAFFIDLIGSFTISGYVVAYFFGGLTKNGFNLEGMPAFLALSIIVAYFMIMKKYFGGTFGKKILGTVHKEHRSC